MPVPFAATSLVVGHDVVEPLHGAGTGASGLRNGIPGAMATSPSTRAGLATANSVAHRTPGQSPATIARSVPVASRTSAAAATI